MTRDRTTGDRTILTASGQDWDAIRAARNADDDRIVVNMGPQHRRRTVVLRLILRIGRRR